MSWNKVLKRVRRGMLLSAALMLAGCAGRGSMPATSATTSVAEPSTSTAVPWTTMAELGVGTTTTEGKATVPTSNAPSSARDVASAAMRRLWIDRDADAIELLWSPSFVEHGPAGDSGRSDLADAADLAAETGARYEQIFDMAQDDLVLLVSRGAVRGRDELAFELVRVVDGQIAESWYAATPVAAVPNASGHTQFDGLTAPADAGAEVANGSVVEDYLQTGLVEGRWEDIDDFFDGNAYIQHSTMFADGVDSVRDFFVRLRDAGVPFQYTEVLVALAEGDFVLSVSRGELGGVPSAFWDLWRLGDGVIAEHWDVIVALPPESASNYFAMLAGMTGR